MNNLYLNRRKIQPKENNNICKERRVLAYILDNMSVWRSGEHSVQQKDIEKRKMKIDA